MAQPSDKVLAVLAAFTIDRPALTLSEIAEATSLPVSTAHRLLERLAAWGLLEKSDQKLYSVGGRLWALGALSPRIYQQRIAIVPYLERLYLETHLQTVLTTPHPDGTLVIEQLLGWMDGPLSGGLGDHLPLHASSPGLVALAFGPPQLWSAVSSRPLRRFTDRTIADHRQLLQTLRRVRRQGVAVSAGALTARTSSVSVPVFSPVNVLYGAVSLVWGDAPVDLDELVPVLQRTARSISAALQATDPHDVPHAIVQEARRRHVLALSGDQPGRRIP